MQRLNILCYIDGKGYHIARALELNLIGGGESWAEALNELLGCIDAQVTYTQTNGGDMSLIWNPASDEYFARYQKAKVALTDNEPLDLSLYEVRIDNESSAYEDISREMTKVLNLAAYVGQTLYSVQHRSHNIDEESVITSTP